jgi:hypothetical protein
MARFVNTVMNIRFAQMLGNLNRKNTMNLSFTGNAVVNTKLKTQA